ncbi:hypothetical protein AKJ52_01985, partial [candidate division MSBL1 archaeon SCGC-AAA382C18]
SKNFQNFKKPKIKLSWFFFVFLGLGFGKREGKVTTIPYESVTAIGDIIIVKSGRTEKREVTKEQQ